MRRLGTSLSLVVALAALVAVPAAAHHSFIAVFDRDQPVSVEGVVTEVQWTNPHIWFFVDVTNPNGTVTNWGFSGGPPGLLVRRGISRDAMKVGDFIVVEGFRARDGSNNATGGSVTFADGRRVFTASAEDPDR